MTGEEGRLLALLACAVPAPSVGEDTLHTHQLSRDLKPFPGEQGRLRALLACTVPTPSVGEDTLHIHQLSRLETIPRRVGEASRTACLLRTRSIRRGGHSAHTSIIKRVETIHRGGGEAPRTACLRHTRIHSAHTSIIKRLETIPRRAGEAPRALLACAVPAPSVGEDTLHIHQLSRDLRPFTGEEGRLQALLDCAVLFLSVWETVSYSVQCQSWSENCSSTTTTEACLCLYTVFL